MSPNDQDGFQGSVGTEDRALQPNYQEQTVTLVPETERLTCQRQLGQTNPKWWTARSTRERKSRNTWNLKPTRQGSEVTNNTHT